MAKDSKKSVKEINELVDLMEERGLSELEIDGERIKIVRGSRGGVAAVADIPVAAPSPSPAAPAASPVQDSDSEFAGHAGAVKSPIVGTAYLSPQPGADPFVKVGDKVTEGQVLLIIEAMKVMNSIQAHRGGTLTHLLAANGDPIEYGQVLAVIE